MVIEGKRGEDRRKRHRGESIENRERERERERGTERVIKNERWNY